MSSEEIEDRIMTERRPQGNPPTPGNPLMYTGEARDEFYARRALSEGLWESFMSAIVPRGGVFGK